MRREYLFRWGRKQAGEHSRFLSTPPPGSGINLCSCMTFPCSGDEAPASSGGQPPPENRNSNRGETMLEMRNNGRKVLAVLLLLVLAAFAVLAPATALAKGESSHHAGGEASLALPDLSS